MAVPTIATVFPASGHTGGKGLCEIVGTGFGASVQVTFGGSVCPTVWAVSSTLLRVLTPRHDPSGVRSRPSPDAADLAASAVVVANLDTSGSPISGETVTKSAAYSFQRPLLDAGTYTTRAIDALLVELRRQVVANVAYNPHSDYDAETGDGLNLIELARLPGLGLTQLRLPTSQQPADREQPEIDIGSSMVAVRAQPVVRDAVLTLLGVSDHSGELQALELAVKMFARDNPVLLVPDPIGGGELEYVLDYQRGAEVTFGDRTPGGVVWFQAEIAVRRIVETDMPGISASGVGSLGVNQATREIAYKAETFNTSAQAA